MPRSIQQVLAPKTVLRAISQIELPGTSLSRLFGWGLRGRNRERLSGRSFSWDIFNHSRSLATGRVPGQAASRQSPQKVGSVGGTFPRAAETVSLLDEDLLNRRAIGGPTTQLDTRGENFITRQEVYLAQRFANLIEFQTAAMIRGSYSYDETGDELHHSFDSGGSTVNFQIPAGNKNGLDMLGDGDIVGAPWSTAGTDIPLQLQQINAAFVQLTGLGLAHVVLTGVGWQHVLNNTKVQTLGGLDGAPFETLRRVAPGEFSAVLRAIPWVTFQNMGAKSRIAAGIPLWHIFRVIEMTRRRHSVAYSYVRFSRIGQIKGDSLRRQTENTRKLCDEKKWELDESLTLHDLGVSAFRGANAETGALATFIDAARSGRVAPDSILIVESLDRLSRQQIRKGLSLILEILDLQINIATISPFEFFAHDEVDEMSLLIAILHLSRANRESEIKSVRLREMWAEKRKRASSTPLSACSPAWVTLMDDGTWNVNKSKARIVRYIFELSSQGLGALQMMARLTEEGIPPLSGHAKWGREYITKLLRNRAVLGEYQPHIAKDGKRIPHGKPIVNYFPAVIGEPLFYASQQASNARRSIRGRVGSRPLDMFSGLLFDVRCQLSMVVERGGSKSNRTQHYVASRHSTTNGQRISLNKDEVEQMLLSTFLVADLTAKAPTNQRHQLQNKLDDCEQRLEKFRERLRKKPDVESYFEVIEELEDTRRELLHQIQQAEANIGAVNQDELENAYHTLEAETDSKKKQEVRRLLRMKLRAIVDTIYVLPFKVNLRNCAHFQVVLKNAIEWRVTLAPLVHRDSHETVWTQLDDIPNIDGDEVAYVLSTAVTPLLLQVMLRRNNRWKVTVRIATDEESDNTLPVWQITNDFPLFDHLDLRRFSKWDKRQRQAAYKIEDVRFVFAPDSARLMSVANMATLNRILSITSPY